MAADSNLERSSVASHDPQGPDKEQNGIDHTQLPQVLMLIPSYTKQGTEEEVRSDLHPTMNYHALQAELGGCAEIVDYRVIDSEPSKLVRAARRGGLDLALAMYGFLRRSEFDAIFSNGENVSIPLAGLFRL